MTTETRSLHEERWELLQHINALTDKPIIALSFVWVGLLVLDLSRGLNPLLQIVSDFIWGIFILDFVVEFIIAPHKLTYLKRNWLTALSLILPAFRIVRVFQALRVLRAARAARTLSLLRVLTSINRGMRATARTLGKRSIGYVVALTTIVLFAGAAGMATFESPQALHAAGYEVAEGQALTSYSDAVWFTAMIMTTLGSAYWPQTAEGRILCFLLSLYAVGVFGYITAAIASFFIGQDRQELDEPQALLTEIRALREQLNQSQT